MDKYINGVLDGTLVVNEETKLMVERFLKMKEKYDYRVKPADDIVQLIETTLTHRQGETLAGEPLEGKPLLLEPFQKFIIHNIMSLYHKGTNERVIKEALIFMPRKNGKALSLDTEIPTPSGWKKMADIHVGDLVFGQDGKPAKVLAESEIFTDKEAFEVTFEDGEVIVATDDHIWTVITKDSRRFNRTKKYISTNGYFETTTKEMSKHFVYHRKDKTGKEYKYRVPMNEPVEYDEKDLSIDPYMLGVWLGDGSSRDTRITCGEQDLSEMISLINLAGYKTKARSHKNRATSIAVGITPRGQSNKFLDALRKENVLENKHIPIKYLQGSYYQRLSLLQGLMDTDGTISKSGQCSFAQSNRSIIDQVCELLSSLGIKNSVRERQVKCKGERFQSWEIQFFASIDTPVFRLKRKLKRQKKCLADRMKNKSIVNIKSIGNAPSKCIYVDNENHLFLAGKKFTATHNTTFAAGLAWSLSLYYRKSGSKCYIVANALQQSMESFAFIRDNIKHMNTPFQLRDNNIEHSLTRKFDQGSIYIRALAASADKQDSLNANIIIADELHAYTKPKQYNVMKEATKAYTNKLVIGISTAGDNPNGFLAKRIEYAEKVLSGTIEDDQLFIFIARAEKDADFTEERQHQIANPNYGVTIRPADIRSDAMQAMNDPQQRKDFLAKSMNIFTGATRTYFDLDEFIKSNRTAEEKLGIKVKLKDYTSFGRVDIAKRTELVLKQLVKLPIRWYGGADLSKLHDLTAAAIYGEYNDVGIVISHAWFPITAAQTKADEDGIPLFGWQEDGWLTMSNDAIVNYAEVVKWFSNMRARGFKIKQVSFDKKFGKEFHVLMNRAGFKMIDAPQYFWWKNIGFRRIEAKTKTEDFYYLGSEAFEYCVSNVHGVEKTDDMIQYEKVRPTQRIDVFDASVFACTSFVDDLEVKAKAKSFIERL